ncbi:uncharacterized protein LOC132713572 isoform X1 [Ruditapes philippinarum]|uniref:uncharacterized protein LOC132713572 isoform X1 n=2 Tax=Ruditapes philippinarum TaxID=129788 RepID=UPI00295AB768|nr:uncharacterized protein LOC132713572 isoform X1 [Ruditapes philippinarum]
MADTSSTGLEHWISMKRVQRIGRTVVLVALPMIIIFTLINMYLFTFFQHGHSETMVILNEKVYNKNSDSSSKKIPSLRDKYSGRDESANINQVDDAEQELRKKSGNGDTQSRDNKDAESLKYDVVKMEDESIDRMIEKFKMANDKYFIPNYFWNSSLYDLTRRFGATARRNAKTLSGYNRLKK